MVTSSRRGRFKSAMISFGSQQSAIGDRSNPLAHAVTAQMVWKLRQAAGGIGDTDLAQQSSRARSFAAAPLT